MPNYFEISPVVFDKKILKVFHFGCHGNQNSAWNGNLRTTLKGDYPRIIPVKFGETPPSGLGGDVIYRELLTDEGHPMITIAHLEPMAQVS